MQIFGRPAQNRKAKAVGDLEPPGYSQKCRLAGDFQQLPGRRRWQDVIFYSKHIDGLWSCVGRAHMPHCIENYCSPQLP